MKRDPLGIGAAGDVAEPSKWEWGSKGSLQLGSQIWSSAGCSAAEWLLMAALGKL